MGRGEQDGELGTKPATVPVFYQLRRQAGSILKWAR